MEFSGCQLRMESFPKQRQITIEKIWGGAIDAESPRGHSPVNVSQMVERANGPTTPCPQSNSNLHIMLQYMSCKVMITVWEDSCPSRRANGDFLRNSQSKPQRKITSHFCFCLFLYNTHCVFFSQVKMLWRINFHEKKLDMSQLISQTKLCTD